MLGNTFSHGTLRKYVIYFGNLFSNLYLNRYDANGTLIQNMRVPIGYGPREKFLTRALGDPENERAIAIQLPRMSFEMYSFFHDTQRTLNKTTRLIVTDPNSPGQVTYQYAPVPYDINFVLSIMVKNAEDGTFIVEQILPFFNPFMSASLNLNGDANQSFDTPIYLNNVSVEDTYEGDFINRRAIIWTLNFTIKGWIFGPPKDGTKNIIKDIGLNFNVPPIGFEISDSYGQGVAVTESMRITPGVDPVSNTAVNWYGDETTPWRPDSKTQADINLGDDFGFMVDFTSNE